MTKSGNDRGPIGEFERPKGLGNREMGWGSDAIAALLGRLDIQYISLNPGASYRGLHDSLVNYLGNSDPQILLTLHEEAAVAIAQGYAQVTDRPMAVALHSNVGLMHGSMAIFNAWCARTPMLILGATGAVDAARRRPWIEWIHTARDQGALVRDFTKWDDQPASVAAALESLLRAARIARTPPRGPVYVCLDVSLQEDAIEKAPAMPDPARFQPASPAVPAADTVRAASDLLLGAKRPLILAGRVSRDRAGWDHRVRLAEALSAKVLTDSKTAAAFPSRHPLHGPPPSGIQTSAETAALLGRADVILSLDWIDLAGILKVGWPDGPVTAKVINCSLDSYSHRGWSMDYHGLPPVDLPIQTDPDTLVPLLADRIEARRGVIDGAAPLADDPRPPPPAAPRTSGPIGLRDLGQAVGTAAAGRQVSYIRFPLGWPGEFCDFRGPLDFLGSDGGAGIGSGPGNAVGAALALKDAGRLPVAILGDGDFLMGSQALWTAARYRLPLLIIVNNNRSFFNDEIHQQRVAERRGRPVENKWIGQRIDDPAPDLAALARAQGLQGEGPVTDMSDLPAALGRGFEAVARGATWVIDVVVAPGYVD